MAPMDTIINVDKIGRSLLQTINLYFRMTMKRDVVNARMPDNVVASPCEDMMVGNIVIMKMPKPKPVVRCTKLAPILRTKISIATLSILYCIGLSKPDNSHEQSGFTQYNQRCCQLFHAGLEDVKYILLQERSPSLVEPFIFGDMLCHFGKAATIDSDFRKSHRDANVTIEIMYGFD